MRVMHYYSGCISLHCTTQILLLQHVSSGAERGHAGNCRSRITISTCSTPSLIQHLKLFNSAAVCCQSELNYSFNIQGSAVGINVSEHFNHCLIIQTGPQCTLRPFKPHPVSQADKWMWFLLTAWVRQCRQRKGNMISTTHAENKKTLKWDPKTELTLPKSCQREKNRHDSEASKYIKL